VDVIRNDWEVVRQYILHEEEVAKVAEVSQPLIRSEGIQDEVVRRMRALIAEQMRNTQTLVNTYLPAPEAIDDKIARKLHQISELRQLAQNPDLPTEERERIRRVLAEMQEDMEKAWTAMELQSVMSAYDNSTGSIPVFFLDILLRPGDW
jgi:hypothetical protein